MEKIIKKFDECTRLANESYKSCAIIIKRLLKISKELECINKIVK